MDESFQKKIMKGGCLINRNKATEFVEENLKTIFAYSLSRLRDKSDAEDLTNDIITAILASSDRIKDDNAFYGYVWKIASNTYKNFLKKRKKQMFDEYPENISDNKDFTDNIVLEQEFSVLRREIALLSKEYRECTVAYYYDGLSCSQISNEYGISLEMVKYYLFKTRKILKEGICMERQFGEKSFRPAPFEFITIFSGAYNKEYRSLFSRKLPGQILLSAYYAPISARELSTELGVGTVYLEDEILILKKYDFITEVQKGKYLTNLVVFTDDYTEKFRKESYSTTCSMIFDIIKRAKSQLSKIKKICKSSENISDEQFLWGLLFPLMLMGNKAFENSKNTDYEKKSLYDGAVGISYGVSETDTQNEFTNGSFAGYSKFDDNYYVTAADFDVLPVKNRYFDGNYKESIKHKLYNPQKVGNADFLVATEEEKTKIFSVLQKEIDLMKELYNYLFEKSCEIISMIAPKHTENIQKSIIYGTLFFRTVGFIGGCAVKSGALDLPTFEGPAAVCITKNFDKSNEIVNQGVLV